jgi:hypothetical protein
MESFKFGCDIQTSNPDVALGLTIYIDQTVLFQTDHVKETVKFETMIESEDGAHELRIVMSGKKNEHTETDDQGNITKDVFLTVNNFVFEDLDATGIFSDIAKYHHNFNGNGDDIVDRFYGDIGCNGTISLAFTTPVYLWLLENM